MAWEVKYNFSSRFPPPLCFTLPHPVGAGILSLDLLVASGLGRFPSRICAFSWCLHPIWAGGSGPDTPLASSSSRPSQASLGQPKRGSQASLDKKGLFGGQVSLGQSHSRHQPPGRGGAGPRVLGWLPPPILRREDYMSRDTQGPSPAWGRPLSALC